MGLAGGRILVEEDVFLAVPLAADAAPPLVEVREVGRVGRSEIIDTDMLDPAAERRTSDHSGEGGHRSPKVAEFEIEIYFIAMQ